MVNHIGARCCRRKQSENTRICACSQRNNLFLRMLFRMRLDKPRNKTINRSRSNVRSYPKPISISQLPSHFTLIRRTTHTPRLIIGNLLVSNPAGVNGCANRSSIYPNRTALNRDTLASLSVFCTTRSLEANDASGPTPPPRDRRRPGPSLRRRLLRLGI